MKPMENQQNKFGLSKKANVAMAAITGITVVANAEWKQSIMGTSAILIIALYHLYRQSKIDEETNDAEKH